MSRRAANLLRMSLILRLLALAPLLVAACVRPASPADVKSFGLVAYQGEAVLGAAETTFPHVFEHGMPVVLNFWAGQCPPCRAEMPAFQRIADEFEGKVLFVGVDVGVFTGLGSHADARQLLAELGIRYPAAYATDVAAVRLYNVRSMPTTLFFDRQGRVVEQVPGMVLESQLRSVVGRLAAGSS
jgi:thiol-disulfide isomerase/thioredoxin